MPETKCGFIDRPGASGQDGLVTHGPTLFVDIGFDTDFETNKRVGRPYLAETKFWALVDTGATESCIDSDLAEKLNLPVIDRRLVGGIGGVTEVNMHLAHIYIPTLSFTLYGAFAGVDLIKGGQKHYALIGRTFLRHFRMTYDGRSGDVILSSQDEIPVFKEFSEVRLARTIEAGGISMPAGSRGVVMATYADGLAYEVEFEEPRHVVLTVEERDLTP